LESGKPLRKIGKPLRKIENLKAVTEIRNASKRAKNCWRNRKAVEEDFLGFLGNRKAVEENQILSEENQILG
jgi:hypothetical protein